MPHSRPLRNSFCKALVRMSSHLVEDTNSKKKAATNANSEALRLAKESLGNKSVQVFSSHFYVISNLALVTSR